MNFADRLDISCRLSGISQVEIAKRLGVTKGTVTQFKTGRPTIHDGYARISTILGVPQEWLEHGTGPAPAWLTQPDSVLPPSDTQTKILNVLEKILEKLTENEEDHLELRRALTRLEEGQTPAQLDNKSQETNVKRHTA